MSITLDKATAERIREILSDLHDDAVQANNAPHAAEIDALCGDLLGPDSTEATKPRIAVDITGGIIHQVIADREIEITFLDNDGDEIQQQLEHGEDDKFAPNCEGTLRAAAEARPPTQDEQMEGFWVMREPCVVIRPDAAAFYARYARDAQARRKFNQAVRVHLA